MLNALEVDQASVLIPESRTYEESENVKEELLKVLLNTLEDKNEDDIRMVLNITNEIFNRFKAK